MSEANKIVARRLVEEAFNKGNYGVIEELVAPTIVNHDPATGDGATGDERADRGLPNGVPGHQDHDRGAKSQKGDSSRRRTAKGTHKG